MKKRISLLLLLVALLFTLTGCLPSLKNPLEIVEVSPNTSIDAMESETVTFSLTVTSTTDTPLSYHWETTGGQISNTNDPAVIKWMAPETSGFQSVTVRVTDGSSSITHKWTIDVGNTAPDVIEVRDPLDDDTVWMAGNTYIIMENITVEKTLTIQPGAIIKFQNLALLTVNGNIIANGTATNPIIFTSYLDDQHGGDTNGDGNASMPQAGDWKYIKLERVTDASFTYCQFSYGGQSDYYGENVLYLNRSAATISHSTFAHNVNGLNAENASTNTQITNNIFYDNQIPLIISPTISLDNSNLFHNPNQPTQLNQLNQILINTSNVQDAITWNETEVPFVVKGQLYLNSSGALSLGNNVIIKFTQNSNLGHNQNLTFGSNVIFTSYRDDQRGGDTNGDGNHTVPASGDWEGIINKITGEPETWDNIFYDRQEVVVAQL